MEDKKKDDAAESVEKDETKSKTEDASGKETKVESKNANETSEKGSETDKDEENEEISKLNEQLKKKDGELKEYIELAQRVKAEFDNYKKRTAREKEQLYTDISGDIISKLLPVVDSLERAVSSSPDGSDSGTLMDGMEMILKQLKDVLKKEGLEEIESSGKKFDPRFHNAVMHVEDESLGQNEIVEVFQKGYKLKGKIIRHSMVKVAN